MYVASVGIDEQMSQRLWSILAVQEHRWGLGCAGEGALIWSRLCTQRNRALYPLLAVFLLALIIRAVFVFHTAGMNLHYDSDYFDEVARNILAGKGHIAYDVMGADRQSLMAPLYPAFLAGLFLFGHSWLAVQLCQSVLGAMTCVLVYLVGKRLANPRVGCIASLASAMYPFLVVLTRELMSETLFIFVLTAWMWFVARQDFESLMTPKRQAISGILQGIFTLIRALTLLLPGWVLVWQALQARRIGGKVLRASSVMVIFFVLTLIPWTIRNYVVHNAFVPVATEGGEMLWIFKVKLKGLVPPTDEPYLPREWYALPEAERSSLAMRETWRVFTEQPVKFIKNAFVGSLALFRPFNPTDEHFNLPLGVLLPTALVGAVLWIREKKEWMPPHHLLPCFFWFMAFLTYGQTRFIVPLLPSLFIAAAFGLDALWRRGWRVSVGVMGSILGFNLLLGLFFPQIRDLAEGPLKSFLLQ